MKSYIRRYLPYDYWNRSTGNRADSISDCHHGTGVVRGQV